MFVSDVASELNVAPGSVVVVRDEEWLVTGVDHTRDGSLLRVQGLSELVRDSAAAFYSNLDRIEVLDPAQATVVADDSPHYRRSRLWLESTLRKTAVPLDGASLTVSWASMTRIVPSIRAGSRVPWPSVVSSGGVMAAIQPGSSDASDPAGAHP